MTNSKKRRRSGDRGAGDDVADRAHQRKSGKKHNQAGGDGHRRFELQPQLGAEPVEHQRGRGRDRAANRVLEEERQSMPVESPIDPVDRHGAQSADQAGQQTGAQGSRRRERQRTPGKGGDPALVRVRRGDDGVKLVASVRRRHLARADATDQTVDGRQSAEVHRPGLHDVQRAGRRRRRPTVGSDVDRRVDDIDLAALDTVRGGDGCHLVHRGGRRHPGRHQDGTDTPGQIEHLAHPRVVSVVELCAPRIRYPRQAVRRWLGFPNDSVQDLATTCPPWLARAITGQLHNTPLPSNYELGHSQRAGAHTRSVCRLTPLVFLLSSSEPGRVDGRGRRDGLLRAAVAGAIRATVGR